tara:strand:+ start:94 stop:315 length:222 start_codon:yes stop_codon:yes gene_type:complete
VAVAVDPHHQELEVTVDQELLSLDMNYLHLLEQQGQLVVRLVSIMEKLFIHLHNQALLLLLILDQMLGKLAQL